VRAGPVRDVPLIPAGTFYSSSPQLGQFHFAKLRHVAWTASLRLAVV
jgi:hypothetical protein